MSNLPRITINDTTFDKIWAYYKQPGKVTLTPKQEEKRERWLSLFTLRLNFHSRLQAIRAYIDAYKQKDIEISESQAYKDMSYAMRLFGDVHKADRQASLSILSEYAHKVFLMAIKQKNPIAAAAALSKMEKYMEIDRIDAINFNPAKLEDKPDHYSVPKIVLEAIKEQFKTGVVDFNNLEIEDVEHEEVENGEEI